MSRPRRRRLATLMAVWCAVAAVATGLSGPASADPEGNVDSDLATAIEEYLEAKETLDTTDAKQDKISDKIADGKDRVAVLKDQVSQFAISEYQRGGALTSATSILRSKSPDVAVDRMSMVDYLGRQGAEAITDLTDANSDLKAKKEALQEEKDEAAKALDKLESSRDNAAEAVAAGGGNSTTGPAAGDAPAAEPGPGADAGFPSESCSEDDPTPADGCITPRTRHALQQAEIAGFQRYVSCFRGGGHGEHPMGRACDFSSEPNGFGGVAGGADKTYGDNLARWFTDNADELGVMYVIWYNEFWDPSQGWTSYTGGGGDPSSDHTNHVHVSIL